MSDVIEGVVVDDKQDEITLKLDRSGAALLKQLTPDTIEKARAGGSKGLVAKATELANLYAELDAVEQGARQTKTYAGAYVVRMMDEADEKTGKIAALLNVSPGRVSQLKVTAKLLFDLGFEPTDKVTRELTSGKQNDKAIAKVIREAEAGEAGHAAVEAAVAKAAADKRNAGQAAIESGEESGETDKVETDKPNGRGAGNEIDKWPTSAPRNNSARFDIVLRVLTGLAPLTAGEWATLLDIHEAIESVLDGAEVKAEGQKVYDKRKRDAEAREAALAANAADKAEREAATAQAIADAESE